MPRARGKRPEGERPERGRDVAWLALGHAPCLLGRAWNLDVGLAPAGCRWSGRSCPPGGRGSPWGGMRAPSPFAGAVPDTAPTSCLLGPRPGGNTWRHWCRSMGSTATLCPPASNLVRQSATCRGRRRAHPAAGRCGGGQGVLRCHPWPSLNRISLRPSAFSPSLVLSWRQQESLTEIDAFAVATASAPRQLACLHQCAMKRGRIGLVQRLMRMAENRRFETPKGWSVLSRCVCLAVPSRRAASVSGGEAWRADRRPCVLSTMSPGPTTPAPPRCLRHQVPAGQPEGQPATTGRAATQGASPAAVSVQGTVRRISRGVLPSPSPTRPACRHLQQQARPPSTTPSWLVPRGPPPSSCGTRHTY